MRRRRFKLRRLSAWELLEAWRDAQQARDAAGLRFNAALTARAAVRFGRPVFASAEAVLRALPEEEIYRIAATCLSEEAEECGYNPHFDETRYRELCR